MKWTPLHLAVMNGDLRMIDLIASAAKVDHSLENIEGNKAIDIAEGNKVIRKILKKWEGIALYKRILKGKNEPRDNKNSLKK